MSELNDLICCLSLQWVDVVDNYPKTDKLSNESKKELLIMMTDKIRGDEIIMERFHEIIRDCLPKTYII